MSLVSRQYVDMTRTRIEGLLAAFIKLVEAGKQHTYVEAESSNILEDLETLRVPEYSVSLDEDGICKTAFDLIFAFDEVMSLGHKENVTVAQVKQYCEMESHEERLHKLVMQNKIDETKDVMKRKASEIDKTRIEKNRSEKGGFMSLQSMGSSRIESGFGGDMSISSSGTGFGNGSGYGLSTDVESFSSKPKGHPLSSATAPPKGLGMQLGKTQKANQFLESLKAEGEVILEDVRPSAGLSRSAVPPLTDPITLSVEEKLNVTLKRDGGVSNFDVQGTLSLQILNQEDGLIQVQIETGGNPGILFKTHPNINKELFSNENILGLKDSNRPFPTGQSTDGVGLLKWRMQSVDESVVPLTINCWPSVSGNETYVSIEYEASSMFDLQNVVISVPLPALREAPSVRQIDGEWRSMTPDILFWHGPYFSLITRTVVDLWSLLSLLQIHQSFSPISVRFTAANTFMCTVDALNVPPLNSELCIRVDEKVAAKNARVE
ncbi:unnamed protein product [Camellia sinensis]